MSGLPIVSLEGGVAFYNIVRCVDECVSEHLGAAFGHSGMLGTVITGPINRRIQTGKSRQPGGAGETVDITGLSRDHSAVDVTESPEWSQ